MCWNHSSQSSIHSRSGFYLKQWNMRVFSEHRTIHTLSLQFPLPCNWSLLLARWLTSSGTVLSKRNAYVAFGRSLSVLTFTVRYPAHSKLVFIHAPCLTFAVSILPRVQVVITSLLLKKNEHFSTSQEEPPSSRSLHLVLTQRVLKPTEPSSDQTTIHIGRRLDYGGDSTEGE
jgi:hypothetical protein